MSDTNIDPSKGQFIDPMFAVVIAAAVSETVVAWTKGVSSPSWFEACVVSLGYVNMLLSWFGYHKSIARKPIRGSLRFIITVILLPLYLLSIILFNKDLIYIATVYSAIFCLWSCWEYFKYIEYGERKGFFALQFRLFNIIVYIALGFLYLIASSAAIPFLPVDIKSYFLVANAEVIVLVALATAIILLRVSKSAGKEGTKTAKIWSEVKALLFGTEESRTT